MNAPTRHEWLEARRSGIGGSDIAALLGVSPWSTPVDVYLSKVQPVAADAADDGSEAMRWGNLLEDTVAREWARAHGRRVQRVRALLRDPDRPWAMANIDRAVVDEGRRARWDAKARRLAGTDELLEVKTASERSAHLWEGDEGSDAVPAHYVAQCLWYLGVTGAQRCHVACLLGGQRMLWRVIERDDDVLHAMRERARDFWLQHVVPQVPPPITNGRDAARLYRRERLALLDASADAVARDRLVELRAAREAEQAAAARRAQLEDEFKALIADHEGLAIDGCPVITWRAAKDRVVTDWEAVAQQVWQEPRRFETWHDHVASQTTTTPGSRRFVLVNHKESQA